MRIIFYLLVIQLCVLSYGNIYAQEESTENVIYEKMLNQSLDFSQNISEDSLKKVFKVIDVLPLNDLYKVEESFVYRSQKSPNESNQSILKYIRLTISNEK